jgi:hypothetical protein
MPADSSEQYSVERQALAALEHLSDEDKHRVLEYIQSLVHLEEAKHDQTGAA